MRRTFLQRSCALLVVIQVVLAPPINAYESDFHYALTKWLAVKAGFCDSAAETIARGVMLPDDDPRRSAPNLVAIRILPFADEAAARTVQEWHFPSPGPIPGLAGARSVIVAGSPAGAAAKSKVLALSFLSSLTATGEALHPLQDSYSHRGVPANPAPTAPLLFGLLDRRLLAFAHPDIRGGWDNHLADHTYLDPASAMDAARQTYEVLADRVTTADRQSRCNSPQTFSSIEAAVGAFAHARTKAAKRSWFAAQSLPLSWQAWPDGMTLREQ